MQHKNQSTVAGNFENVSICTSTTKVVPRNFSRIENYKLIFTWHGNCLLTRFNFSIKILLATIAFLFWILLCYLLNILSFCLGSISWCFFVVTLFHCSFHVPLFRGIPIVLSVFGCMSAIVPCSGLPGFIVCQLSPPK